MSPMQPGSPMAQMPPGEDALIRKIQEIERTVREILPSVAGSFGPVVADLRDLIAKVVVPAAFSNTVTAFDPIVSAWASVASVTLTVPDGFSQAVVTASCYAAIINTTPSTDTQIHARVLIDTEDGPVDDEWSDAGRRDTCGNTYSAHLTSLTPGSTFDVAAQAYAGADFTAHANNKAVISGTVLWLR